MQTFYESLRAALAGKSKTLKPKTRSRAKATVAIYSASVKTISRSAGRSATAAAAYRTGTEVICERHGVIHDYTRKGGVEHVSRFYPHAIKDLGTEELWNRAEASEKRKNSTVARELLVALPYELSSFQRKDLAQQIGQALVGRYQVAAEVAIHQPDDEGDGRNHHTHIMFSTRRMDADGMFGEKTRELDDRTQGEVDWIREMVEVKTNNALEAAGLDVRVDRRSLKDQMAAALEAGDLDKARELDRDPQIHLGPRVNQIMRECLREDRMPLGALDRLAANDVIDIPEAKAELADLDKQIRLMEALESAHAEALIENDLRVKLVTLGDNIQAKEYRIADIKVALFKNGADVAPAFEAESKALLKNKKDRLAEAKQWRENNPIKSKFADMMGFKISVDVAASRAEHAYESSDKVTQAKAWNSERKEKFAELGRLKKDVSALKDEESTLKTELLEIGDRPATDVELLRSAEKIEDIAPSHFDAAGNFAVNHIGALSSPAAPAALGGLNSTSDVFLSDIIKTGNPAVDQLAQAFKKFQREQEQAALSYVKKMHAEGARATQKVIKAVQQAIQGVSLLFATTATGQNFLEPGETLTSSKLKSYGEIVAGRVKNVDTELRNAVIEAKKSAEIEAAIERNTREMEQKRKQEEAERERDKDQKSGPGRKRKTKYDRDLSL